MSNLFDSIGTSVSNAASAIASNPVKAIGTAAALGGALSNLSNPGNLLSKLRSINLPAGGNPLGRILLAAATFAGADLNGDWRVRLSIPGGTVFDTSPLLAPIHAAGGLVFPYTPSINISHSAKYDPISTVHNNYAFQAYQSSQPDSITITAPYYCEDSIQAAYWLATVHFLRSATKMFTGDSEPAGNPPVILRLNGYGDYVFKDVPVVITSFSVNLDANSDYISATAGMVGPEAASGGGTSLSGIAGTANAIAGLTAGLPGISNLASKVGSISGAASAVSNYINNLSMALTSGVSHVPTKSSFTITLQPAYSRESVKTFNLQKFVNGDYMTSSGAGYI